MLNIHNLSLKLGMAGIAGLAMTTSVLAISPPDLVLTGELNNSSPTWTSSTIYPVGQGTAYETFQLTVNDSGAFQSSLYSSSGALILRQSLFHGGSFDAENTSNAVFLATSSLSGPVSIGQYTLVISEIAPGWLGTFVYHLSGATLGWGPTLGQVAQEQGVVAANEVAQALSASIFSAIKGGIQSDGAVVSRNTPFAGLKSGSGRTWFQADYTAIDGTDLEGRFPTLQGGFDFQLENGMLLGAALGYSDFSVRNATSDLKGESLTIQPYLGFQLGKTTGSVSLSFGQLDLDTADGAGSAEGDTRGINLSLERGFTLGGQQLVGEFDAGFGRQDIDEGTGTLAGLADTHSTWSYASLGARYEMQHGNVNSSIGGSIDYNDVGNLDNLSASHYGSDGFTGAINVSFDYGLANGSNVYFRGEVGGLGGDAIRKTVQAGIDFRF